MSPYLAHTYGMLIHLFFDKIPDDFRYILIDTPPIWTNPETKLLASKFNGIIMVIRYKISRKDLINETKIQMAILYFK